MKLNSNLTHAWSKVISTSNGFYFTKEAAIANNGDILISGSEFTRSFRNNAILISLNSIGEVNWINSYIYASAGTSLNDQF